MWLLEGRQSYWEGNKRKGWLSVREIERDYRNGFRVVVLSYVRDTRNFNPYQPPFLSGGNRQRSCFRQISTLMVFCGQRTEMRLESCPVLIYPLIFLPPLCLSLCLLKCYVSKQMQELLHLYKLKWENTNCFLSLGHIYHFRSSKGKKYVLLLFVFLHLAKVKIWGTIWRKTDGMLLSRITKQSLKERSDTLQRKQLCTVSMCSLIISLTMYSV